ncbi:PTS sugar transporter subunit IIA [Sutterella sp.]|uniref:PTS sugar transporter subunit IIA n=1 Tax=Sutterella sp. TaxID=1981025 RepID=UPI0026E081BF|nr:PTS sugar transporter subunit IIA [Sutterella sp.]MDO5530708.1 PTS sugar transporter subunit IIA [Sutterella sp.]
MNLLSPFLNLHSVRIDLDIASQKRLFEEAALAFERTAGIPHDEAFAALSERERIGSTALGHGTAVPHGRLASLEAPEVVFLRTVKPLKVPSPDRSGAQLFIAILVPESNPEAHLGLLREVAALFSDDAVRAKLLAAKDPVELCDIIAAWVPPAGLHPAAD